MARRRATLLFRLLRALSVVPLWVRIVIPLTLWAVGTWLLTRVPRMDGEPYDWVQAAYASLKFFTLDPTSLPTGESGWDTIALWVVMFAAPVVTATAAADFIRTHVLSAELLARAYSGHVVVCGAGLHGRVIARMAIERGLDVIVLDEDLGNVGTGLDFGIGEALVLRGDMTEPDALRACGVERARQLFFAAGDPLVNLRAAAAARLLGGTVADGGPRLHALVDEADVLDPLLGPLGLSRDDLFDQYRHAASRLAEDGVVVAALNRIRAGDCNRSIAIVGFGRFGQAVMHALLECPHLGEERSLRVEVVDRRGGERAARLLTAFAQRGWTLEAPERGDAERWVAALEGRTGEKHPSLVFLCLDHDPISLRCASRLFELGGETAVVVRVATALHLAEQPGFVPCSVPELFGTQVAALLR